MPLITGKAAKSREGIAENIRRLIREGKSQDQAVAIAMRLAGKSRKGKKA